MCILFIGVVTGPGVGRLSRLRYAKLETFLSLFHTILRVKVFDTYPLQCACVSIYYYNIRTYRRTRKKLHRKSKKKLFLPLLLLLGRSLFSPRFHHRCGLLPPNQLIHPTHRIFLAFLYLRLHKFERERDRHREKNEIL